MVGKWRWAVQFISRREVLEMIGVSRSTLGCMVRAGTFPAPACITERNRRFVLAAVEGWMKAWADSAPYYPEVTTARRRGPRGPVGCFRVARRSGARTSRVGVEADMPAKPAAPSRDLRWTWRDGMPGLSRGRAGQRPTARNSLGRIRTKGAAAEGRGAGVKRDPHRG